jgi:valyl-tRNA synthetase
MPSTVPKKPSLEGLERTWTERWEAAGTYRFDRSRSREQIYSIDTPPPTVSGSLHMGSVFGYVQTDSVARYHRMRGDEVFYPMGWDDNGLPTERRVENFFGVRCDPSLPYDPDFQPPGRPDPRSKVACSRPNFVELCLRLTAEDEKAFEDLWQRVGLSVDWLLTYTTIGPRARRASQQAFLRNLARSEAYQAEAPSFWDVTFQTAVAQAEMQDREVPGAYFRYGFSRAGGKPKVMIDTTRPELLAACVALVAHPDDGRYRGLVGERVVSPVFGVELPVVAHELADPEKGTGIAMICTFGDTADVTWWRELQLPTRVIVERNGHLQADIPDWIANPRGREAYTELAGKTIPAARARMVELLQEAGELDGSPRSIVHPVKFYENGDRPLEIVSSRQWYIRNGGRDLELRQSLLERGKGLEWHPPRMYHRYENWVEGLTGDWLISRQRYFGVPFPVWYPVDGNGNVDHDRPIVAPEEVLPVDPSADAPPDYHKDQRGRPGGFVADPDIMDTWATSSLTPQIVCGWADDADLFKRTFPLDLRPQGFEIIRTWLFDSIVRAHFEHDCLPWDHALINGWVLDPDRKKMSKSRGNVITPVDVLEEHGSDAVRYWACSARSGTDTAVDENQFRVGRRLAIKILNASRFVLGLAGSDDVTPDPVSAPLDQSMLAQLAGVVEDATAALESYEYSRALERTEAFFWSWCDDYVELVKSRAYGALGETGASSARAALALALGALLRLFAPFLPFVTEEVWSWWRPGSVHRAAWPSSQEFGDALGPDQVLDATAWVLGRVRSAKTERRLSMRAPVSRVTARLPAEQVDMVTQAEADLREAGTIARLVFETMDDDREPEVSVILAEDA